LKRGTLIDASLVRSAVNPPEPPDGALPLAVDEEAMRHDAARSRSPTCRYNYRYGHSSYHGGPVEMFCFISGKYAERGDETPVALNCLRIREKHFLDFLQRWVNWLEESSVMKQLAA
jgi:hypothetical protein